MPGKGVVHGKGELPFQQLSSRDFERLCYWLVEAEGFECVEHLGAGGRDRGRDIQAERFGRRFAFQCKRHRQFGPTKAREAIAEILRLPVHDRPAELVVMSSCDLTPGARDAARKEAGAELACTFWGATELDKLVKRHPEIIEEFFARAGTGDGRETPNPAANPKGLRRAESELSRLLLALRDLEISDLHFLASLLGIRGADLGSGNILHLAVSLKERAMIEGKLARLSEELRARYPTVAADHYLTGQ